MTPCSVSFAVTPAEAAAAGRSEVELVLDRREAGFGASLVLVAAGGAGNADTADNRPAGLDDEAADEHDDVGQIGETGAQLPVADRLDQLTGVASEIDRRPGLAGGGRDRSEPGIAVAQHDQRLAEAVDDHDGDLQAVLA